MSLKWDRHFLKLALVHAELSKDPSTKVGSVIVGLDREILSLGFNGFPRGVEDVDTRLQDRETRLQLMVHAEMNAVLAAARNGVRLKGGTLYVAAIDSKGGIWGGAPCIRCTVEMIQSGIAEVVSYPLSSVPTRWFSSIEVSIKMLREAGVTYREVPLV